MQQDEAFALLKMGGNIFLTGAAGSGKTYLLNQYINYLKENQVGIAVTASTGIAATHIHGTTLHSWSGIGIKSHLTQKDLEKLNTDRRIKSNYKKTKVLIIDEVSMLHKYQLDMVDEIARYVLECEDSFGGMQVVLCGDFFQLPPVSSEPLNVEKQFAFEASAWKNGDFQVCYLSEQHRQNDDPLLVILNDIRNGTAGEHTKIPLRTRYKKEPLGTTKATKLYTRNINVDAINDSELQHIHAPEKTFTMETHGFSALVEGLKKNCLAPEQLKLKVGAEVMFIKNDLLGQYVNGTRGVVLSFDKSNEGWPIIKTFDNRTLVASPLDWNYEDNGVIHATITQVPLRLAWAITIHKSQGMTLDAAEVDLGDAFEPGMGYVALSRVRSLSGLKIMNLNEMALKVHPKILQHDQNLKECSTAVANYLNTLSIKEKTQCQQQTLIKRFAAKKPQVNTVKAKKAKQENTRPTHFITLELLKKQISVPLIAEQRGLSLKTIINHLEKLKGLKQIEAAFVLSLQDLIPKADFDLIFAALEKSEDGKLKPIYEQFNGKYLYADLQLVRLFVGI